MGFNLSEVLPHGREGACEDDLAIEENLHACTGLWAIEHASDFEMVGISQNRTHGVGIEAESVLLPRRLDG